MNLTKPARDCTDSELDERIAHFDTRRAPQPLEPMDFRPPADESWQAAHAASEIDDDPPHDGGVEFMGRALLYAAIVSAFVSGVLVTIALH